MPPLRGRARHLAIALVLAGLLTPAYPSAAAIAPSQGPGATVGAGGDCGGADTPPSHHLTSGTTCSGSLDEAHTHTTTDLNGNTVFHYADKYDYDATDGDGVQVTFNGTSCMSVSPSGSFVANGTGNTPVDVTGRRNATPGGTPTSPCPDQPTDYTLRVTVTPNDRPAVNPTSVPTSGRIGETVTFEVSATDPDGNGRSIGIRHGPPSQPIQWNNTLVPSASWSTTFEQIMYHDLTVTFFARDFTGAISPASPTYTVLLIQDDCGWGRDAVVDPVTLPHNCEGYLTGTDVDSFTFTLGADRRARARMLVGSLQGFLLTFTSPTGVVTSSGSDDFISGAEAGTWRLDVRSDGDTMSYTVDVREIGLPAPPVLVLVLGHSPVTHQGDVFTLPMTGFDPNDQTLQYQVEWSDGIKATLPFDARAPSGQTETHFRRFWETTPTYLSGTVTVTNTEGLSDTEPFDVAVVLHNDCGFGTPVYDAPEAGTNLRTMPASGVCNGTVGHSQPNPPWSRDASDHYRSSQVCSIASDCKLRATLTTSPGLAATVTIDNNVQRAASSCSFGGCTTQVELIGPSFPNANFPQVWVTADGGQGSYSVKIEKLKVVGLPI